jgi:NADH-quinone oxidoreductase subunit K
MIFSLKAYMIVSALLFSLGVYGVSTRRNAVSVLMGLELILNAANINFVAFSRFLEGTSIAQAFSGQVFSIFVIMLAATEAVIALAIVVAIYKTLGSIKVDEASTLKA